MPSRRLIFFVVAFLAALPHLFSQPKTLSVEWNKSKCDYCGMLFQFKNFGGQVETKSSSRFVFDAAECTAAYLLTERIKPSAVRSIWVVDYAKPTSLIDVKRAAFLQSDSIESPMSVNLLAFASGKDIQTEKNRSGGRLLLWNDILALISRRWFEGHPEKFIKK